MQNLVRPTPLPSLSGKSLDEVLGGKSETFQQRLLKLIDESGMTDAAVYKKANIDRKVFSSIRCKPDYKPKKKRRWPLPSPWSWTCPPPGISWPGRSWPFPPATSLT